MTNVHKNIISFLLGSSFVYLFIWLVGLVAAMPVPEFLRPYNVFVIDYYSKILLVSLSIVLSSVTLLLVRKVFNEFSKQNLGYFSLPIIVFLSYLMVFFSVAVETLIYAALPSILVGLMINLKSA